eukprot:352534-Chlamydomonas_euryale.AAC.11
MARNRAAQSPRRAKGRLGLWARTRRARARRALRVVPSRMPTLRQRRGVVVGLRVNAWACLTVWATFGEAADARVGARVVWLREEQQEQKSQNVSVGGPDRRGGGMCGLEGLGGPRSVDGLSCQVKCSGLREMGMEVPASLQRCAQPTAVHPNIPPFPPHPSLPA